MFLRQNHAVGSVGKCLVPRAESPRTSTRIWAWAAPSGLSVNDKERSPNHSIEAKLNELYPSTNSFNDSFLRVSKLHTIYYRQYGNPYGIPALFVHGGPGSGCFAKHSQFFDPDVYHIILMDQRGCGKSTPSSNLSEQNTAHIIFDMELLRKKLRLDAWLLVGGSWGVALSLAYAAAHPNRVMGMVLRGVCLMRKLEMQWFSNGSAALVPSAHRAFLQALTPSERSKPLQAYYARLTHPDKAVRSSAARQWAIFEHSLALGRSSSLQVWTGSNWEKQDLHAPSTTPLPLRSALPSTDLIDPPRAINAEDSAFEAFAGGPEHAPLAQPTLTCHYAVTAGTGVHDGQDLQLLEQIDKFRHIPTIAIHGRNDIVCPIRTAYDLHEAWPEMELQVVPGAGHSQYDPRITHCLVQAIERMAGIVQKLN